jgi:hypothetical protein
MARMTKTISAAIVASLMIAGCGGGGGLEKKALVGKANAICEKYAKRGEALGSPDLTDPTKAEDFFNKAHDLAREQQDELVALKPADDVKADYGKLTKATGDATTLLGDLAAAAKAKDQQKGVELIQKLRPVSSAVDTAAKKIGADGCAG